MSEYSSVIEGILSSHLHMDRFSLVRNNLNEDIFDSYIPPISPRFGNNSGFKVFQYDVSSFDVVNFHTYYLLINKIFLLPINIGKFYIVLTKNTNLSVCTVIN